MAHVASGAPRQSGLDLDRYQPKPPSDQSNLEAWKAAIRQAQIQLEHEANKFDSS